MLYIFLIAAVLCGFIMGYIYRWHGIPVLGRWKTPFVELRDEFAIGISKAKTMDTLQENSQQVLSKHDVTDVDARFVADPFLIWKNQTWYMFMEVLNKSRNLGEIGLATSKNGLNWTYEQIILKEPYHLSYPYVFEYDRQIWMIPETGEDHSVRLYRCMDFPKKWQFEKTLLRGRPYKDASIFHHNDYFWMFAACNNSRDLMLYYSRNLSGPWQEHPCSPVIYFKPQKARCAGRVIKSGKKIIRFAQNCEVEYGTSVHAFIIEQLDTEVYKESPWTKFPVLSGSGQGWNKRGMHHIDLHHIDKDTYIAAVDGIKKTKNFNLKS